MTRLQGIFDWCALRGEGDPDTVMRDEEDDGPEGDRSPMESDTYVRYPIDDFSD